MLLPGSIEVNSFICARASCVIVFLSGCGGGGGGSDSSVAVAESAAGFTDTGSTISDVSGCNATPKGTRE
jgi:hypothetical protein